MNQEQRWQLDGTAAELYQRYLVRSLRNGPLTSSSEPRRRLANVFSTSLAERGSWRG